MSTRIIIYLGYYLINVMFAQDYLSIIGTLPIMALVMYHVAQIDDRYFTLWDMVHFLMYLFFVIEPIQVIDHGHIGMDGPVSPAIYTNTEILTALGIAAIFYGVVSFFIAPRTRTRPRVALYKVSEKFSFLFLGMIVGSFIAYVYLLGGLGNIVASRWERFDALQGAGGDSLAAFIGIDVGIMTALTFVLATQVRLKLNFTLVCFAMAMLIVVVCVNPFNTSRFSLLSAYVPMGFMLTKGKIRAVPVYAVAMFGIVMVMPILSITTRFGMSGLTSGDVTVSDLLHLKFVDAFDLLVECVNYVAIHGHDYGSRLLADVVAYFPRALWPGKPTIGSQAIGQGLVDIGYFGTENVSQIVAADGYMDFGIPGVILVGLVVGLYLKASFLRRHTLINGHDILSYAFVAALPILLRGPLTAVISIFLFQALTIWAVRRTIGRKTPSSLTWETSGLGIVATSTHQAKVRPQKRGALSALRIA